MAESRKRGKYRQLSLKEKVELITEVDVGVKKKDVVIKFNIKANTLSSIYKNKENILKEVGVNSNMKKKKCLRQGKNSQLDAAVSIFINEERNRNVPINGSFI